MIQDVENIHKNERIAVFIDSANFYSTICELDFKVDYLKLKNWLSHDNTLDIREIDLFTYTNKEDADKESLLNFLSRNGYRVIKSEAYSYDDRTDKTIFKEPNIIAEICVYAMDMIDSVDHFVFFTGDKNLLTLYQKLQSKQKKVTVVSSKEAASKPLAISVDRIIDNFVELNSIRDVIEKFPE